MTKTTLNKSLKNYYTLLSLLLISIIALPVSYAQTEGIQYKLYDDPPHKIHVLHINPDQYQIKLIRANDQAIGRESVYSIAKRTAATVAINGGFFKIGGIEDGLPVGALKINHHWVTLPSKPRAVMGWDNHGKVMFDRIIAQPILIVNHKQYAIKSFNKHRNATKGFALFTPIFGEKTLSTFNYLETIVINNQIQSINQPSNSTIPPNGFVINSNIGNPFKIGESASYQINVRPQTHYNSAYEWNHIENIVNGTPLLIAKGKPIRDYSPEKISIQSFIEDPKARTAVGVLNNGAWVFVIVEHSFYQKILDKLFNNVNTNSPSLPNHDSITGLTLKELTDFMLSLKCQWAINLDGGGSSTLYYNGSIINSPNGDEDEGIGDLVRKVSDSIVVIKK